MDHFRKNEKNSTLDVEGKVANRPDPVPSPDIREPPNASQSPYSTDTSAYLSGWRLAVVITCLFFGAFLIALDTDVINVAVPTISSEFESLGDVAWYGTAYLLLITSFQPIFGTLYTHFGTNAIYRSSVVIFELGSVLCAAAPSSNVFIAGRAIAGLGAAGILQGALSIIGLVVPIQKRPLYMGIVISVFAITVCVGPPLGGAFTQHVSWRWCFWINLPIGAVVLIGLTIFLKLKNDNRPSRSLPLKNKLDRMDPLGCIVFIGAICCLALALQWGGQKLPWKSATVIGLMVGFVLIMVCFVFWQYYRQERALIRLRVLCRRDIFSSALVLFFLGASQYVNVFFLPFYFQAVRGVDPVTTGVRFIPLLLPMIVTLIVIGAVVKQWGQYVPYIFIGEFILVAGTALLTQLRVDTSTVQWAATLVVTGIGMGMAMQLPYTAVQITLHDDDIPTGNAIAVLSYQLGGAIAISMGQTTSITTILADLPKHLPGFSAQVLITAGAANLHSIAPDPRTLAALRVVWSGAIRNTMILSAALAAASVPCTLGLRWLNAREIGEERLAQGRADGDSTGRQKQDEAGDDAAQMPEEDNAAPAKGK